MHPKGTPTSWGEKILDQFPTKKPGISVYEVIMERLNGGANYGEYQQAIRELHTFGYLCHAKKLDTYWREPERIAVLHYLAQYKTTSSMDVEADQYVAMQLGIDTSRAHGLLMKALRKLVHDNLVIAEWAGTGEGGTNDCCGTRRYKTYALKSWLEEK